MTSMRAPPYILLFVPFNHGAKAKSHNAKRKKGKEKKILSPPLPTAQKGREKNAKSNNDDEIRSPPPPILVTQNPFPCLK